MTKKEIRSAINKAVYQFAETLGYSIHDDNDGSYVTFVKGGFSSPDESIDYSRSYHETYVLRNASDEVKSDAEEIETFAKEQVKKYLLG